MEAGIKILQDKIAQRDKEVARLKEDLENATRQTEAAVQRALANAGTAQSVMAGPANTGAPAGRGDARPPGRGDARPPARGEA